MFTYKELHLIDKGYFKVLRYPLQDNFIEIQSKNTKDSWIIQKRNPAYSEYPIQVRNIIIGIGNVTTYHNASDPLNPMMNILS